MSNIVDLCKKDQYNFLSPYGLGDTMMLCGFAKSWEAKNKGKIHFIIKPSHEVVMKMYGFTNYTTAQFDLKLCKKLGKSVQNPQLGKLFVAHPIFIKTSQPILKQFESLSIDFKELYSRFLDVDVNAFKIYENIPKMTSSFRQKIEAISSLDKIILFSPTANSVKSFPQSFWENLCCQLTKDGFSIISNVINPNDAVYGTHYLPMTTDEVVALAHACHSVYSLRSGLCDIIGRKTKNLTVFYDNQNTLFLYGLNKLLNRENIVEEVVNPYENQSEYNPLVTVVTVTYNLIKHGRKDLIIQNLESVYNQSYKNVEHIIIDGASTDGTLELLKPYADSGWIKIYSEKDTGIYDAMNKGIDRAQGKYVAFLNSDDFYHNLNGIELAIKKLEENHVDFAFGTVRCVENKGENIRVFYPCEKSVMASMPFSHQGVFCRRDVLYQERFDTQFKLAADYDLILRLYLKNYKRAQIEAEIATYRMDGLSGNHYEDCVADYKRVYEKHYNQLIPEKYYDGMIRHNIIPTKIKKKFRKIFLHKQIVISLLGIPVLHIFYIEDNTYINLFKRINLIRIKRKGKGNILYVYLLSIFKCVKINKKENRIQ